MLDFKIVLASIGICVRPGISLKIGSNPLRVLCGTLNLTAHSANLDLTSEHRSMGVIGTKVVYFCGLEFTLNDEQFKLSLSGIEYGEDLVLIKLLLFLKVGV